MNEGRRTIPSVATQFPRKEKLRSINKTHIVHIICLNTIRGYICTAHMRAGSGKPPFSPESSKTQALTLRRRRATTHGVNPPSTPTHTSIHTSSFRYIKEWQGGGKKAFSHRHRWETSSTCLQFALEFDYLRERRASSNVIHKRYGMTIWLRCGEFSVPGVSHVTEVCNWTDLFFVYE